MKFQELNAAELRNINGGGLLDGLLGGGSRSNGNNNNSGNSDHDDNGSGLGLLDGLLGDDLLGGLLNL